MAISVGAMMFAVLSTSQQRSSAAGLQELKRLEGEAHVRAGDVQVQLDQLREQRALANPADRVRFNKPLAALEHQYTVAMADLETAQYNFEAAEKSERASSTTASTISTMSQPPRADLFGRRPLEIAGLGAFLLMMPLVLSLARRIWTQRGPMAPGFDFESSPRLQRLEDAVESIAVEVERIGEAQRFATKLLAERRPDAIVGRNTPPAAARPQRHNTGTPIPK